MSNTGVEFAKWRYTEIRPCKAFNNFEKRVIKILTG